MIVVDTNIIAYLYFPSDHNKFIEDIQSLDKDWVVPTLWKSEFLNVATQYYRKGLITFPEALEAINKAGKLVGGYEIDVDDEDVMIMVKNSTCSSYHCEFIALADQLNTNLITYDNLILKEFPNIAISPEDYLAQLK